jgi:predicted transcriptional regulator of viral defense system
MMSRDTNSHGSRFDRAIAAFKNHGGILHTAQALRSGIHPGMLYAMRDFGELEMVSRGVYRLADSSPLGNPDLVTVATRVPGGVICLISALAFHEITTQIPHEVHVARCREVRRNPAWTTHRSRPTGLPVRPIRRVWSPMNSTA